MAGLLGEPQSLLKSRKMKPILKWAGGKTQLLSDLLPKVPSFYGKYIEPFFGGGALFFALSPQQAVISDANGEIINLYKTVADDVEGVINELGTMKYCRQFYYEVRGDDWSQLSPVKAAARTIYLNKSCFNGLYRVNKKGEFNVPFGRYDNPKICDAENLRLASDMLRGRTILCADYKTVLREFARPGDFVYLDPPYMPTSEYSDFKRYTKEQFYTEDHVELAAEVEILNRRGCHVALTNSNHPLVHDLFEKYDLEVVGTKRNISCNGKRRSGEDVIVTAAQSDKRRLLFLSNDMPKQTKKYPPTRFMGSKEKMLPYLHNVFRQIEFHTAIDLFSGTGVVSYLLKCMGKKVMSNDYMTMNATIAQALIENNSVKLSDEDTEKLFVDRGKNDWFVSKTFEDLYFTAEENRLIDIVRKNIKSFRKKEKRAIGMAALIRACIKKRPRGIFTYTGQRYNDGRADLKKSLREHISEAVQLINNAVFSNDQDNIARHGDAMDIKRKADLVYVDPPYYSPYSDNEYVRRYHFVEGLACDWEGVQMQWHTKTKKFKSYPTPFSSRNGAYKAFDSLFRKLRDSVLVVSYSSNSLPPREDMLYLMAKYKSHVQIFEIPYKYSFANQKHAKGKIRNDVREYLFVGI